ncbi:MAG: hypothetical protein ACWGQW_04505 [bacterium]
MDNGQSGRAGELYELPGGLGHNNPEQVLRYQQNEEVVFSGYGSLSEMQTNEPY